MPAPVIDENQFLQLVRQHQARMMRVARAFVANCTTAEEVVQETWLVAIEKNCAGHAGSDDVVSER